MKYYLAHHGVQNQHWGVRHGPPYPLDSNASKQAKRKSASKSSYDKLYGDKKGSTSHTGSASSVNINKLQKKSNQITTEKLRQERLKNIDSELNSINLRKKYPELKKVPQSYTEKINDITNINKVNYSSPNKFNETTENCCNCATAYILRQAGYDVKAKPFTKENVKYITDTDLGISLASNTRKYLEIEVGKNIVKNIDAVFKTTNTRIAYATLFGHCFIVEKDKSGKITSIDPQDIKSPINEGPTDLMNELINYKSTAKMSIIPVDIDKLKSGQGIKYYDKFVEGN